MSENAWDYLERELGKNKKTWHDKGVELGAYKSNLLHGQVIYDSVLVLIKQAREMQVKEIEEMKSYGNCSYVLAITDILATIRPKPKEDAEGK